MLLSWYHGPCNSWGLMVETEGVRSRRQDGTQTDHNVTCLCPPSPKSKGLGTPGPILLLWNQNLTTGEPGKHREALISYYQNQSAQLLVI